MGNLLGQPTSRFMTIHVHGAAGLAGFVAARDFRLPYTIPTGSTLGDLLQTVNQYRQHPVRAIRIAGSTAPLAATTVLRDGQTVEVDGAAAAPQPQTP